MMDKKRYTLVVDHREEQMSETKTRMEALEKRDCFDIETEQLAIGDILIKEKNAIIEVKTIEDFYNSIIQDNHIFNQAINMKANYENCSIIIIGYFDVFTKGANARRFAENYPKIIHVCMGAYISLMEKYKIKVYWVGSPYLFSKTVEYIADKAGENPEVKDIVKMSWTTEQRWISMLTAIDKIGIEKAKVIAKKYPTMKALIGANMKDLMSIPGIGEVIAGNIMEFVGE